MQRTASLARRRYLDMPKNKIEDAVHQMAHIRRRNGTAAVNTQEDARLLHLAKVNEKQKLDEDAEVHDVDTPFTAFVDWGRWIILCTCGAGVAVHPEWTSQYCFGCGAVFSAVVFPSDRDEIEATLVQRHKNNRFFLPHRGETLETLKQENRDHGLEK